MQRFKRILWLPFATQVEAGLLHTVIYYKGVNPLPKDGLVFTARARAGSKCFGTVAVATVLNAFNFRGREPEEIKVFMSRERVYEL